MRRTAIVAFAALSLALPCAAHLLGMRLAASAAEESQTAPKTPEELAFLVYEPNSAFEVTVTNGVTVRVYFSIKSGYSSVTMDWGDGTTSVHTNSLASHTYAVNGTFVVQLSDTIYNFSVPNNPFVTAALRWGNSLLWADYAFSGCKNLTGFIPRWPAKMNSANKTYNGCSNLAGEIPAWGAKIASANGTFYNCRNITGAWANDAALLMPTKITEHDDCVSGASDTLRALFYEDWGGTREKPADE